MEGALQATPADNVVLRPATPASRAQLWARRWFVPAIVTALLIFYVAMALFAAEHKGLSYDEGEQIAIGYNIWRNRDFRMEAANGDLVKRWATLPLLVSKPTLASTHDRWWRAGGAYEVGFNFFFKEGNDPRAILRSCRAMVALVGVATALLVFLCARELFGNLGGLISLTVFVTSPSMLAFGGMVSTEMTTCLALAGSAWSSWRVLQRVTWRRVLASGVFASLLVLSKPTAVVMLPVTAILIAVRLAFGGPLMWQIGRDRLIRRRSTQALVFAVLFAVHIAVGWGTVWAAYDFRYTASPIPADRGITFRSQPEDPIDPTIMSFLQWSRRTHFLPEGYLHGIQWLLGQNESQVAFMNGKWKYGGWPTFFPYAMWAKTQPAFLLLFAFSIAAWGVARARAAQRPPATAADRDDGSPASPGDRTDPVWATPSRSARAFFYAAVPFVSLIVVYFAIAITWDLNIGFRHVLPIYPAAYILAGAVALLWPCGFLVRTIITAVLAWHVAGPIQMYPHYLAYFSPVVGGPANGYKHLVDSSLDWGMDLPEFKTWLDVHNPGGRDPVYFAYFGVGDPDYYGIKSLRLPSRPDWRVGTSFPLGPGIYAISATLLQGIGTKTVGPWNKAFEQAYWRSLKVINAYDSTLNDPKAHAALLAQYPPEAWNREYALFERLRFGRLCAWLRHHRPPDDNVGYSILIWRLTQKDVFDAGLGPPAELANTPLRR